MAETSATRGQAATGASAEIEVRVLFFGRAREVAGVPEGVYRVPEGASVADLARRLARAHPGLQPHLERCSFAVNESYAARQERVRAGDEVAVIPPIGGG